MESIVINPRTGIAGDMLFSALYGLAEKKGVKIDLEIFNEFMKEHGIFELQKIRKKIDNERIEGYLANTEYFGPSISFLKARHLIDSGIKFLQISRTNAIKARRTLEILISAETKAHQVLGLEKGNKSQKKRKVKSSPLVKKHKFPAYVRGENFRIIGYVESSLREVPLQPLQSENEENTVKIVVDPELKEGLKDLNTFEKIWVIAYLHKSRKFFSPIVFPPWDEKAQPRGVFSTRSPIRPSPIALSKAEIIDIVDNIIILKSLDLIDGTPVLDIKPVLSTVDLERANNGWLENTKHLELHKKGIPHVHEEDSGHLHEAADIVFDILGVFYVLDQLNPEKTYYIPPIFVGGGDISFSHGTLKVPAPATKEILEAHRLYWDYGPVNTELTTPTGVSILASLSPIPISINRIEKGYEIIEKSIGWGHKKLEVGNYLELLEVTPML